MDAFETWLVTCGGVIDDATARCMKTAWDAATAAERERCARIADGECNTQISLVDGDGDDWGNKACQHAAKIAEIIHQSIRAGGQP